jgi:hypothetical protein
MTEEDVIVRIHSEVVGNPGLDFPVDELAESISAARRPAPSLSSGDVFARSEVARSECVRLVHVRDSIADPHDKNRWKPSCEPRNSYGTQ